MSSKPGLANIDGDILVYRSAFAAEHNVNVLTWDGGEETFRYKKDLKEFIELNGIEEYSVETTLEVEPLENALRNVKSIISGIIKATKPSDIMIYLSGPENRRDSIATIAKYKGNRDHMRRPHWYEQVREYISRYYDSEISSDGDEADDLLARHQTEDTVLVSLDKDLLQVPGKHYNWVREEKVLMTEETALRNLWCQVLAGDNTDNVPGIYRCGVVTAAKWLAECTTVEEMEALAYEKWEEYLCGDNRPKWITNVSYWETGKCNVVTYNHWDTGEELTKEASRS